MRLIVLGAGWLLGVYVGSRLDPPLIVLALLLAAALVVAFLARRRWRPLMLSLLALAVLAGAIRSHLHQESSGGEGLALYNETASVALRGVVASYPEQRGSTTRFRLTAREILLEGRWQPLSGQVLVTARETRELVRRRDPPYFRVGDLLWLKGELRSPPSFGDFDFPAYLAQQGVRSVMAFPSLSLLEAGHGPALHRLLYTVRSRLSDSLGRTLPEPQNGLAQAIALGIRGGLPGQLSEDFNETGTAHLLAISGLHVSIVMLMTLAVSRRLLWRRRLLSCLLPVAAIWLYALVAGLEPSAHRAAVMGSFYLAALYFGRQRHGLEALLLAAMVITAFSPMALWQVSFQLSFLAMAGIVLVAPPLHRYLAGEDRTSQEGAVGMVARWILASAAMGAAATLFTWAAVAFYFHRVSLVGIPATILALPALPVALAASLLTGALGLLSTQAAWAFGWAAWLSLSCVLWVVQLFAAVPLAAVHFGAVAKGLAWGYYSALAAAAWGLANLQGLRRRLSALSPPHGLPVPRGPPVSRFGLLALLLTVSAALAWGAALSQPRHRLDLYVLDVGQGDAILLRTPSRHTILVDGGPDPQALSLGLGPRLPLWSRRIDLVVLTHPQQDHIGGLARALEQYDVRAVLEPDLLVESAAYAAWDRAVRERGIPRTRARAGQEVSLGDVRIQVLNPPQRPLAGTDSDLNNNSVVLRVTYGSVSFLLTGDIQALAEQFLLEQKFELQSTVLKVPHHGSRTSSTPQFLKAVHPYAAAISVGADNRFGHPDPSTVERLRAYAPGETLFLTSLHGTVRFSTDGERLWVKTER